MTRVTTSARRRLSGPWTKETPPLPRYPLTGAARFVIAVPAALIVIAALILLVSFAR